MYKLRTVKSIDLLEALRISEKSYVRDMIFTKCSGVYLVWTLQDVLTYPVEFKFFTVFEENYWDSKGNLEVYNGRSFKFKDYPWIALNPDGDGFWAPGARFGDGISINIILEKFGIKQ